MSLYDYQSKPNRCRKKLTYLKTEQQQIKTQQIHENQEENISIIQRKTIKPQQEKQKETRNIKPTRRQGLKWQ